MPYIRRTSVCYNNDNNNNITGNTIAPKQHSECVCVVSVFIWVGNGTTTLQFYVYLWKIEEKQNHNPTAIIMIWPIIDSDRMTVAFVPNTNCDVRFKCSKNILEFFFWNWVACMKIKKKQFLLYTHPHKYTHAITETDTYNIHTHTQGKKQSIIYFIRIMPFCHHLFFDSIKSK